MQVPIGFAALWLIAGLSAIWIFYVAWRDAYQDLPDPEPVLVGLDDSEAVDTEAWIDQREIEREFSDDIEAWLLARSRYEEQT